MCKRPLHGISQILRTVVSLCCLTAALALSANGEPRTAVEQTSVRSRIESKAKTREAADSPVVGNLESFKYHRPDCEFAKIMSRHKRMEFKNQKDASDLGMQACNWCFPRWWTSVEGTLLYPQNLKSQN